MEYVRKNRFSCENGNYSKNIKNYVRGKRKYEIL